MKFKRIGNHLGYHVDENDRRYGPYYVTASVRIDGQQKNTKRSLETEDFQTAKTKGPATYAKLIAELKGKPANKGGLVTVGDAIATLRAQAWSLKTRKRDAKPKTLDYYEDRVKALFASWTALEALPLVKLTPRACELWANEFAQRYSGTAFNNTLFILRCVVALARREGLLAVDPLANIQRREVSEKAVTLPTREQVADILRVLGCAVHKTARDAEFLFKLSIYSGVRQQEAMGLQWEDADFAANELHIKRQRTPTGEVFTPKNGEARSVTMNGPLRELLLAEYNRQGRPDGKQRMTRIDSCRAAINHACKVVKCHRFSQHDTRRIFATNCLQSGVDVKTLAVWLGHKDGGVLLLKTYAKLISDHSAQMAKKVSFEPAKEPENVVEMRQAKG